MAKDPAQQRKLDELEQTIASLRVRYLTAVWNGHAGEAEWLETLIDEHLDMWEKTAHPRPVSS